VEFTITCEGYFSHYTQTIPVTVNFKDANLLTRAIVKDGVVTDLTILDPGFDRFKDDITNGQNCRNPDDKRKVCDRWLQYRSAPFRICHKAAADPGPAKTYALCAPTRGDWTSWTTTYTPRPCESYCQSNLPWVAYNPGHCACTCLPPLHADSNGRGYACRGKDSHWRYNWLTCSCGSLNQVATSCTGLQEQVLTNYNKAPNDDDVIGCFCPYRKVDENGVTKIKKWL
jgi:hypothetical protein